MSRLFFFPFSVQARVLRAPISIFTTTSRVIAGLVQAKGAWRPNYFYSAPSWRMRTSRRRAAGGSVCFKGASVFSRTVTTFRSRLGAIRPQNRVWVTTMLSRNTYS